MIIKGKKVTIIGSGNWGSAIAKVVGVNAMKCNTFDPIVRMYVYEEILNGVKLSETINTIHENVKYLPGHKLPSNVVAVPDVRKSVADADILIFVIPHQFVSRICLEIKDVLKPTAIAISLIKGFEKTNTGVKLISQVIQNYLNIEVCVLMGANLANEVADGKFCETTIGCREKKHFLTLKDLFETDFFRVSIVEDKDTVEACGALKNIVACAAGFCDGLKLGDNTKAAVIRLGLMEMISFVKTLNPEANLATFLESCGIADLITTCYGGRNRKVSKAFVETNKPIETLEKEMLNGQKLQGPITAEEVFHYIETNNKENDYPLFTAVHKICTRKVQPNQLVKFLTNHPVHRIKSNL